MLFSKFDLCKSEWLELVFDDRNKNYGAYELRQHYGNTMAKAMGITFLGVGSIALLVGILVKPVAATTERIKMTVVPLAPPPVIEHPKVEPPKPVSHNHVKAASAAGPISATKVFVPLVVSNTSKTIEPPKISELSGPIGPAEIKGPPSTVPGGGGEGIDINNTPGGNGTGVVEAVGLERMPEPYGGSAAWSKFLKKNLEYPDMAIDEHIQGRVIVSFIVEKDGSLSNIVVGRGIGYGLDQEAIRVLKLSPAWQPGIQNGHPVRVRFNIPINFQLE